MTLKKIETNIDLLINQIKQYQSVSYLSGGLSNTDSQFIKMWRSFNVQRNNLLKIDPEYFLDIQELLDPPIKTFSSFPRGIYIGYSIDNFDIFHRELVKTKKYIQLYMKDGKTQEEIDTIHLLDNLFEKFHVVARQLSERHDNRETINVRDEYDVQDLLHALLKISFDDIRPEEWTPSYAGKSSRIDFLLKKEKVIIETKMTRGNLNSQKLGDELIIDTDRYKKHVDCKILYCFVYDPSLLLKNPTGLEKDLSRKTDNIKVIVKVKPK